MDGLASIDVGQVILEDSRGHLWFTSFGSGVTRYDGESFRAFNKRDGLIGLDVRHREYPGDATGSVLVNRALGRKVNWPGRDWDSKS